MNYPQVGKTYTSNNVISWFQGEGIEGYKVPTTLTNSDFGDIIRNQKENIGQQIFLKQGVLPRGNKFEKASRPDIFVDKRKLPGPTYYFQTSTQPSELQVKTKAHSSFFLNNIPRFKQNNLKDSAYLKILSEEEKIDSNKRHTLCTADVVSYFDEAGLKGTWTPGPGTYNPKIVRHKSLSHFSKSEKNSFPEIYNKKDNCKKKGIGPETYMIPRSLSLVCSVKFKQPLKESDSRIKEGISRANIQRQKAMRAGPGRYLKIEDWNKYKNSKRIINGFDACSRPVNQLKIYT